MTELLKTFGGTVLLFKMNNYARYGASYAKVLKNMEKSYQLVVFL